MCVCVCVYGLHLKLCMNYKSNFQSLKGLLYESNITDVLKITVSYDFIM